MTVRTEAEKLIGWHREGDFYYSWDTKRQCLGCQAYWPCRNYLIGKAIIHELDASAPQCLDDPPLCSHRLVPDRQEP